MHRMHLTPLIGKKSYNEPYEHFRPCFHTSKRCIMMHVLDAFLYVCRAKNIGTYIRSQEGTQQGDPLASLMYISGLRPVHHKAIKHMMALQKVWISQHPDRASEADGWLILAYADDIFIVAPPEIAAQIYMQLNHEVIAVLDATFNLHKLEVVTMGDLNTATQALRRACQGFTNRTETGNGYMCKYEVLESATKLRTTYTFHGMDGIEQYTSTIFSPDAVNKYMTSRVSETKVPVVVFKNTRD